MTSVAFHLHVGADERAVRGYLCRLLAKAYAARARVWVVVEPPAVAALDEALWTLPADDFVPHVRADQPEMLLRRSPIVIAAPQQPPQGVRDVLVNAQPQWLAWIEAAAPARVIEVVGSDEQLKAQARLRWRRYQQLGWPLQVHDRAARSAAMSELAQEG
ncbi:DNA polymerase III subunit chi [Tepidimonas alkaliphilus]|uniref:DNA polymerase III subunit chi n=1 Tax=Tepidimonas alkaliphilus TaxID=2588942 RepID=A0A554WD42_9BURK|nr:DNA polymerase III subunit chi [Tepidimonas alkaliphilus]TSE21510.1 DNA polymerase III subunit chi [Tepidimonas alkaliphilus]